MCSCHVGCLRCDRSERHANFTFIAFLFVGVINKAAEQNFKILYGSLYWRHSDSNYNYTVLFIKLEEFRMTVFELYAPKPYKNNTM
jgi:hypothetical protein